MLSHWSCSKLAMPMKGPDVLEPQAAPVRLASAGVVDVLAELIDAPAAGVELREAAPAALVQKARPMPFITFSGDFTCGAEAKQTFHGLFHIFFISFNDF